jgi:hypothetical protein
MCLLGITGTENCGVREVSHSATFRDSSALTIIHSSATMEAMARDINALGCFALTDAVLDRLKEQSPAGCLLCIFEAMDEEDWD